MAAEVYAKQAKLGKDIELKAAEYIVRAERRLGEMLVAAKAAGQITKNPPHQRPHVPDGNISREENLYQMRTGYLSPSKRQGLAGGSLLGHRRSQRFLRMSLKRR
jgi:hypothetical protein